MARDFGTNATQRITNATTPVTAVPLTLAARVNPDNISQFHNCVDVFNATAAAISSFWIEITSTGTAAAFTQNAAGANASAATVATATAGAWNSIIGVFSATNSRTIYLNGTTGNNTATNTTDLTPAGISAVNIGEWRLGSGAQGDNVNHQLAEVAIWNAALAVNQVVAYIDGVSPLLIRPDALVGYWPLYGRTSPEVDIIGARDGTITNIATVTQSAHPRIVMPSRPAITRLVVAAPGGQPSVARMGGVEFAHRLGRGIW